MSNKMMRKSMSLLAVLGLSLAVGVVIVGFCSAAKAEEFAGEIVIGDDEMLSGAYSSTGTYGGEGAFDYWKSRNYRLEAGGRTYKVKHMMLDNKTDVAVTVSNFYKFIEAGAPIIRVDWTPGLVATLKLAEQQKVPIIGGGYSKSLFSPPSKYMYGAQPSYPGITGASIKWYNENVWKGPGRMKVGLLLWDNAFGRAIHTDSVYGYLKEDLGVDVLPTEFYPMQVHTFTSQLMRLKEEGANLIYFMGLTAQYAMLAKDASRLGLTPKVGLIATLFNLTDKYVEMAGAAGEGTYAAWQYYVDPGDDTPAHPVIHEIHDLMEKYRGDRYYNVMYIHGYAFHTLIHHILKLSIEKYGFPITGEQVAEVTSNLRPWDWGLSRYFTGYAGGDRLGWHEVRLHQVKKGKVVCVSDWLRAPDGILKREPWITGGTK
jgi:ABC-type branched-subunit amino acid transport system substrate-binding protein